jgi:AraC-like DNA-binding protein
MWPTRSSHVPTRRIDLPIAPKPTAVDVGRYPHGEMARPTKEPPVSSSIVPSIVRYAAERGVDVEALALRYGLAPNAADADVVTVAWDVPNELLQSVARAGGEHDLSLRVATRLSSRRQKLVEIAVRASATVRDAAVRLARWVPLVHDGLEGRFEERDGEARWTLSTPRRPRGAGRFIQEVSLVHALSEIREGVAAVTASRVWFQHARPSELDRLVDFFGTRELSFGHEHSGFALRTSDLDRPMQRADARTVETIAPLVDAELAATASTASLAARVGARVAASLPEGTDVAAVARALHMSARTLQRRLEDEGTRFTEVLDRARLDVARRLLADPKQSLLDVAFRLGFADLATFSRAFKRWTGTPPGQWRRS